MKIRSKVNVWFSDRNYGFVHVVQNGSILKYFLHGANIISGTPQTGASVLFEGVEGKKGLLAVNAEIGAEGEGNGGAA
jgi:hypothetical protein